MSIERHTLSPRRPVQDLAGERWLRVAASFFALAVLLHNGDHTRRGADSIGTDLFWVGTAGIFVEVGVVVVVFLADRRAPLAAASIGLGLATAYVLVHALPERSWLSDPVLGDGAQLASRIAVGLLIVAAVVLGASGVSALRARGGLESVAVDDHGRRPIGEALTHPVVAAMILGNIAVLVSSFVSMAR